MSTPLDTIREALEGLRRKHSVCEDPFYSCPKSGECSDDGQPDRCNCGADAGNARIDAALSALDALTSLLREARDTVQAATGEDGISDFRRAYRVGLRQRLAALPLPASPLRPEVLAFALAMEDRLRANDHKGGWSKDHPSALYRRLLEESVELRTEVEGNLWRVTGTAGDEDRTHVRHEAADVGNFAMMIADVCGALPALPASPLDGVAQAAVRLAEALDERDVDTHDSLIEGMRDAFRAARAGKPVKSEDRLPEGILTKEPKNG